MLEILNHILKDINLFQNDKSEQKQSEMKSAVRIVRF